MRDQTHTSAGLAEQRGRIDIRTTHPRREVERPGRRGHEITPVDPSARPHQDPADVAVGDPQSTRVVDAHEEGSGHRPGERDHPRSCGHDGFVVAGVVLDAAVAPPVRTVGQTERVEDRRTGGRRQDLGCGRPGRLHQADDGDQHRRHDGSDD